jgi:hypothetical protein
MNTSDYLTLFDTLTTSMLDDPILNLAYLVAWLDPLRIDSQVDDYDLAEDYYYADQNNLEAALHITRDCFPELYADAIIGLNNNESNKQVEQAILDGISARGIPMEVAEWEGVYAFGIPLPAMGVDIHDIDSLDSYHNTYLLEFYHLFGIEIDMDTRETIAPINVDDVAFGITLSLTPDLRERYQVYERLYWLLGWAFAMTGNSSCDYTYDIMAEFEPLSWTPDEVEFAIVIATECDEILTSAHQALTDLQENKSLRTELQCNIELAQKRLPKKGKLNHDKPNPLRLAWSDTSDSTTRTTRLTA